MVVSTSNLLAIHSNDTYHQIIIATNAVIDDLV